MTARTIRQEMEVGRRHAPAVAWPTLLLLAGVCGGLAASTWLAMQAALPMWAAAIVNGVILYGTYTIVHEGVHDNIVPRNARSRWVNMAAAFLAAIPLWMLIHPHRKSHMVHHTRCNTEEDPDIYARGSFGVVTFWRIPLAALGHFNPLEQYRQCQRFKVTDGQRRFSMATYAAYWAAAAAIVYAGYGYELLVLWFVPFFIGYAVMLVFFTWIPHHPHTLAGRYHDTRCSLWPGGNLITQGQNYHLIHHMMPWVPWYRYERVYEEIEPLLKRNDALIDGFWPRPPQDIEAGPKVAT
jgi:fatty acid desaturase